MPLPSFSGDRPRCWKCGYLGADTEWKPARSASYSARTSFQGECLIRTCIRCAYTWREATVPAPTVAAP